MWLHFVAGRAVSAVTTQFLVWVYEQLAKEGKRALLLIWDNASWHISQAVREWIRTHNRRAKGGGGVRIIQVSVADQEPVAESDRAALDAWQAGSC